MRAAGLSYEQVGATLGVLPVDYRHLRRHESVGVGQERFHQVAERLMTWQVHRAAGLAVQPSGDRAQLGAVVLLGLGLGRLRLVSPCLVVTVLDEPFRRGFAYGTLRGHPESGEELFVVTLQPDDSVHAEITAFSRPARWWSRAAGPAARFVQDRVTDRYMAALAARD